MSIPRWQPRETSSVFPGKRIADSLFELYAPSEGKILLEVLFFHGLQLTADYKHAYWTTWLTRDGTDPWPRAFLSKVFPQARMLSVRYDASPRVTPQAGRNDMYNIGEGLCRDIIELRNSEVGQDRPMIWVGHGVGGLVIQKFILTARKLFNRYKGDERFRSEFNRVDKFLGNLKGIFYYSPPFGGSRLADSLVSKYNGKASPVLLTMQVETKETGRTNEEFREWRENNASVRVYTVFEQLPTTISGITDNIVVEASAIKNADQSCPCNEDHFNVCRPESMNAGNFIRLTDFIQNVIPLEAAAAMKSQAMLC